MSDIIVTWPKKKSFDAYMAALSRAKERGEAAFFKVPHFPNVEDGERCYQVHDGMIRGWMRVLQVTNLGAMGKMDTVTGEFFPEGIYVIRKPEFHFIEPVEMKGFRGYRYVDGQL